jgi:hypothetical protein
MKIKISGVLSFLNELIGCVEKELSDYSPDTMMTVEWSDGKEYGSGAVYFQYKRNAGIRVTYFSISDGTRYFELEGDVDGVRWLERCRFNHVDLERGIRATAAYLAARVRQQPNDPPVEEFAHYFESVVAV